MSDIFEQADAVAIEHLEWCRQHGICAMEVARLIGMDTSKVTGLDDVRDGLAVAWLMLRAEQCREAA